MAVDQAAATSFITAGKPRYDRVTIALHWLSALLVIALFVAAYLWNNEFARGSPPRKFLQALHISLGILFTAVFIARLCWRTTRGHKLPSSEKGLTRILSKGMHHLLYLLLTAQIVLGYLLRWAQGEPFSFFNLFTVPSLFGPSKPLADWFEFLHNYAAWTIIILALGHAVAALTHHYLLKDDVLKRMLPIG
jgi:cytochrome b561